MKELYNGRVPLAYRGRTLVDVLALNTAEFDDSDPMRADSEAGAEISSEVGSGTVSHY